MADPINATAQINNFTYIKYLKHGKLNQGVVNPNACPVFGNMRKIRHSGQLIDNKIKIGDNASAGPDAEQQFELARSKVGTGDSVKFERKWFNTHSWGFISEKVDFQTQMGGAAYRELDEKIKENKLVMSRSLLRDFWGNDTGLVDTIKDADVSGTSAVLTLNTNGMSYLRKGDPIQFTKSNGTVALAKKASSDELTDSVFYIDKINYRTNKITLTGKPSHLRNTSTTASLADGDFLYFVGGIGASRQKGILSYAPTSIASNDNFLGVNRSLSPSVLSGHYMAATVDISGAGDFAKLVWDLLVDATSQVQDVVSGADYMLDCLVMNYKTHNRFLKSDYYKDQFRQILNQQQTGGQASIGVNDGAFKTSRGNILPFKISNCVPDDEIVGLRLKDWAWSYLGDMDGDFTSFAKEGSRYIFLDEKSNLYKFRLRNYSQVLPEMVANLLRLKLTVTE